MPSTCSSLQHAPPAHLARGAGLALPPRLGSRTRLTSGACRAARAPMSPVHTALDSTPSSSTCSALVGSSGSGSMNGNSCHAARPLGGPYARPGSTSTSSAPGLPQHSVPSRAALVRTSVLDRQGSAAGYGNAEAWASQQQPHGTGQEEARAHGSWQQPSAAESESRQRDEEADHSGNQVRFLCTGRRIVCMRMTRQLTTHSGCMPIQTHVTESNCMHASLLADNAVPVHVSHAHYAAVGLPSSGDTFGARCPACASHAWFGPAACVAGRHHNGAVGSQVDPQSTEPQQQHQRQHSFRRAVRAATAASACSQLACRWQRTLVQHAAWWPCVWPLTASALPPHT